MPSAPCTTQARVEPSSMQRARQQLGQLRPRHADDLTRRARGVRQRTEQIERRANPQLTPGGRRVLHRRMKRRREEERDVRVAQRALDDCRRRGDVDAELFEHVGAAAAARHRSIAVLRDLDAAGGDDDRRRRRDVERARPISAGAAGVEHVARRRRQLHRVLAHRPREADDLGRPLAFHHQRRQQRRQRARRGTAFHDLAHGRGRLVGR